VKNEYYDGLSFRHSDGRTTIYSMQVIQRDNGTAAYVVFENPSNVANQMPAVNTLNTKFADSLIQSELKDNPAFEPRQLSLYVQRPQGDFQQIKAKTTLLDFDPDDSSLKTVPAKWQLSEPNGSRFTSEELESVLDVRLHRPTFDKTQHHSLEATDGPEVDRVAEKAAHEQKLQP